MRKLFINPEIEIKKFELENIVTSSGGETPENPEYHNTLNVTQKLSDVEFLNWNE